MNAPLTNYLFQEELYSFTSPLVVLIARPWSSLNEDELVLLNKIINSVGLSVNAVQILERTSASLSSLRAYAPARVLVFGNAVTDDLALYKGTAAQGFTVIRADDLSQLDDQKKKNLWLALREVFGI